MADLRGYIVALTCVATATALAPIALAFAVLDLGGSTADIGWVLAARTAPQVLLLLLGGVAGDRFPRHLVLVTSCGGAVAADALAGGLLVANAASLQTLVVLGGLSGIAAAFIYPALSGMLPLLVSVERMPTAASVTGLCTRGGAVLGMVAGGVLAANVRSGIGLLIVAVTMLVAAFAVAPLRHSGGREVTSLARQIADGWSEFRGRTWLWSTVCGFGVVNMVLAGAWATVGPAIAEHSIGRAAWGVVVGVFTAGLAAGHAVLLRFRPRRLLGWGIAATFGVVPVLAALFAPNLGLLLAFALLAGTGLGFFSAAWRTTLGQQIPAERLSRVSAYDGLGSYLAIPVGQLLAGRLASDYSPRAVVLGGAALAAIAIGVMLIPASVRRLPDVSQPVRQPHHHAVKQRH